MLFGLFAHGDVAAVAEGVGQLLAVAGSELHHLRAFDGCRLDTGVADGYDGIFTGRQRERHLAKVLVRRILRADFLEILCAVLIE